MSRLVLRRLVPFLQAAVLCGCGDRNPAQTADSGPHPGTDAGGADIAPGAACRALESLQGPVKVAPFATRKALFTRDSRVLVAISAGTSYAGELFQVSLPSGAPLMRAKNIFDVEWLGGETALLAKRKLKSEWSELYDLILLPFPEGAEQPLVQDVCEHRTSRDGARIYTLSQCDQYRRGTLSVLDLGTRQATALGQKGTSAAFEPSADGRWLAFLGDVGTDPDPNCKYQGNLYVADAAGQSTRLAMKKARYAIVPLTGAQYLVTQTLDCSSGSQRTALCDAVTATSTPLDCVTGYPRVISPDRSLILDARMGDDWRHNYELAAVRTDCSQETVLAADYDPVESAAADYSPIFSKSGKLLVYTTQWSTETGTLGLKVVPAAGGTATSLGAEPFVFHMKASPVAEELVLVNGKGTQVELVSLTAPPARERVFSAEEGRRVVWPGDVEPVEGGEGLLVRDQTSPEFFPDGHQARLHYSRRGGSVKTLSSWDTTKLPYAMPFAVDPAGCAVVYSSDAPELGTYLVPFSSL